jgi:hypothetical protein
VARCNDLKTICSWFSALSKRHVGTISNKEPGQDDADTVRRTLRVCRNKHITSGAFRMYQRCPKGVCRFSMVLTSFPGGKGPIQESRTRKGPLYRRHGQRSVNNQVQNAASLTAGKLHNSRSRTVLAQAEVLKGRYPSKANEKP